MVVGKKDWGTWAQGVEVESKVSILPSNLTFFSQAPDLLKTPPLPSRVWAADQAFSA